LLGWCGKPPQARRQFLGWLPIVSSVTLLAVLTSVSIASRHNLKVHIRGVFHTYDVLVGAQTLLGDLANTRSGMLN